MTKEGYILIVEDITMESQSASLHTRYAPRACAQCRGSKKKCDKLLPSCSRCVR